MPTKKTSKRSKLSKFFQAPIWWLIKAKDVYIKSMKYSDHLGYGTIMGCPTGPVVTTLPKSSSANSTKSSSHGDEYKELLKGGSSRDLTLSNRVLQKQQSLPEKSSNTCREADHISPRSFSVGIGRIDEEKPCDFDEDDIKITTDLLFPRSRSNAFSEINHGRRWVFWWNEEKIDCFSIYFISFLLLLFCIYLSCSSTMKNMYYVEHRIQVWFLVFHEISRRVCGRKLWCSKYFSSPVS